MKLSFVPADLHLTDSDGQFVVTIQGTEVFRSKSKARAIKKYDEIRSQVEKNFPAHGLSDEDKKALMQFAIGDALVQYNSIRPEKKAVNRTRTFG